MVLLRNGEVAFRGETDGVVRLTTLALTAVCMSVHSIECTLYAGGAAAAAGNRNSGTGAVCLRTALFTEVGFYEACNNKVR
jgi:hypothetical protein